MKFFEKRRILNMAEYCEQVNSEEMFPSGEFEIAASDKMSYSDIMKEFNKRDMYLALITCKLVLKGKEVKNAWVDISNGNVVFSSSFPISMEDMDKLFGEDVKYFMYYFKRKERVC